MDIDPLPAPLGGLSPLILLLENLGHSASAIEFHAPPSWGAWIVIVTIAVCCLGISAFVSGSEIAYFGLRRNQIEMLEEDSTPKAAKACRLLGDSERLLATILIANNLVNITMVVLLTFAINQTVDFNSPIVNFLLQTAFLTFLLLLFGEIFPKLVARSRGYKWVLATSGAVTILSKMLKPVARMMVKSSFIVNRIVTKKEETVSADELEKALEITDIKEGKEKEMLEGILSFGEKQVSDIMISRVDVTAIEYHADWDEAVKTVVDSGYSRIPVFDTSQDTIKGVLYSKDLLPYIGKRNNTFHWQTLLREAYFVPESRMIDDLLEDFRKRNIHIAVVVDEYGGTRGIVTLEDIIEEIVGEIDDEYDDTQTMYRRIGDGEWIFEGKISLIDFCHVLGIEEETLGDVGDSETLAGLLLELKGDFPQPKEELHCGNLTLQAISMARHRILKVKVTQKAAEEPDDNATPAAD